MDPKEAIAKVEAYTTAEVMGASKQEYRGMLMVTHFVDVNTAPVPDEKWPDSYTVGYRSVTSQDFANQVKQCKMELLWKMKKEAVDIGANAVVGIKTDDTAVTLKNFNYQKLKLEMYGTAVYFIR